MSIWRLKTKLAGTKEDVGTVHTMQNQTGYAFVLIVMKWQTSQTRILFAVAMKIGNNTERQE